MAEKTYHCDCLNDCGDDPWLKDGSGRATPCTRLQARQEEKRQIDAQLAKITALRQTYGAATIFELIDKMHATSTTLKGEAKVMRDLLDKALTILETIDEEDDHERELLSNFKRVVSAVVEYQLAHP